MKIEIDQSGKVEKTSVKTVVADSLGNAVVLSGKKKRLIEHMYRQGNRHHVYMFEVFAILVANLIEDSFAANNYYQIDPEYHGQMDYIKSQILKLLRRREIPIRTDQIFVKRVTKYSQSHTVANEVFNSRSGIGYRVKDIAIEAVIKEATKK